MFPQQERLSWTLNRLKNLRKMYTRARNGKRRNQQEEQVVKEMRAK